MTDEVKAHLFEPFFTTKPQGKGTGLGLATVYGIVKQSGGEIAAESEPGRGAAFTIYFPLLESPETDKAAHIRREAGQPGKETILLVEDEEPLRRLGERVLREKGYTVLTAVGGEEALAALERRGKPVDLLMTDMVMPGMDGTALVREVKRRNLSRGILCMSGYLENGELQEGDIEPGATFLNKPFTPDALLKKVREVLDAAPGKTGT